MKASLSKWTTAAVTAAVFSLPLAGTAFAQEPNAQQGAAWLLAANDTMSDAKEEVSDTWITSKVKAVLLADDSISGSDIKVETNKGVVSLSGTVKSDAERDLAVEKAKSIKGVMDVSADGLKSAE